ncbi:UNVERIFIED_CONTAM: hypothetical protein K2H54_057566 [Gekko kuhli]
MLLLGLLQPPPGFHILHSHLCKAKHLHSICFGTTRQDFTMKPNWMAEKQEEPQPAQNDEKAENAENAENAEEAEEAEKPKELEELPPFEIVTG